MNMILFGDGHTHIRQMDSLTEVINEKYDIVFLIVHILKIN